MLGLRSRQAWRNWQYGPFHQPYDLLLSTPAHSVWKEVGRGNAKKTSDFYWRLCWDSDLRRSAGSDSGVAPTLQRIDGLLTGVVFERRIDAASPLRYGISGCSGTLPPESIRARPMRAIVCSQARSHCPTVCRNCSTLPVLLRCSAAR